MKSKTIYYCDCCYPPEEFDTAEACRAHERESEFLAVKNDLRFYNERWDRLDLSCAPSNIFAVYAKTAKAADYVDRLFDRECLETFTETCGNKGAGHYFYYDQWYFLEDCQAELDEIKERFEE